jgi:superfamily II DNA or RNA helicase
MTRFTVGSLVRARGRDWVVLPGSGPELLVARPLAGGDDEIAGILPEVEDIKQAEFPLPDPDDVGNAVSAGLLRTALRVGFRAGAGPFRSLAGLAVEPRPYQLVPLMMALRQETVRLLIADDVGIGKTIEAGLVAAELLAQGSARGLTVLCAPALAEQWQAELATKFRVDAELVLPSTVRRLGRQLLDDENVFDHFPHTVVSTDFIKSRNHRDQFIRSCSDLVIVDEAHTCVADGAASSGRTLRYDLVRRIAADPSRHLLLVTATPHSGKDEGFRNLIGLLDPALASVDLGTAKGRDQLAKHMVQRRRGHIRQFLGNTPFPSDRETKERQYYLSREYKELLEDVFRYARETVRESGGDLRKRVRFWSALALLRAFASSPAAAAVTLSNRAKAAEAETVEEADALGRGAVLDLAEDESTESVDVSPGADDVDDASSPEGRRLRKFAKRATELPLAQDRKLAELRDLVPELLGDGYDPVIFCRFIATAAYVADNLRDSLGGAVQVGYVTGAMTPEDRESRIKELTDRPGRHVLVATDCLSEGVNLQEHFQAVVHYDLAWNPTRHEQREGRVDRFGQPKDIVRAFMLVGADNRIDEVVMKVLLRKHEKIRKELGISVPVPDSANQLVEVVAEQLLVAEPAAEQPMLDGILEVIAPQERALHAEWESSADREKAALTKFAQAGIKPEEVARELEEIQAGLGTAGDVEEFVREALDAMGSSFASRDYGFDAVTSTLPAAIRDSLPIGHAEPLPFHRDLPVPRKHAHLDRTDNAVEVIARAVLDSALDVKSAGPRPARRCGVIRTDAVAKRTTMLLVRFRFHLTLPARDGRRPLVAEEARVLAFRGRNNEPDWLGPDEVEALLAAQPTGNVAPEFAREGVARAIEQLASLEPHLDAEADAMAARLHDSHVRVREATRQSGSSKIDVTAHKPADVLGVYLYVPAVAGGVQ